MKIEHIFVIHYHKEVERKKYLNAQLPLLQIPYTFRSLYDRNSPELLEKEYFDSSEINKKRRNDILIKYGKTIQYGMPIDDEEFITREKGLAYRAATLEHYKTYEYVVNETNYNNVLILEDDVCFKDGIKEALSVYENALPDDYDICYIGSGCNLQLPIPTTNAVEKHPQLHSRCSDSYIVSRKALIKILKTALPFYGAIDWDLNYIQMLNNFNVYWASDPKTYQGSQHGHYVSCFHL